MPRRADGRVFHGPLESAEQWIVRWLEPDNKLLDVSRHSAYNTISEVEMQLGKLCERLGVEYRHARYVLEEDILPQGVDPAPDRGNHRQLDAGQSYWLGIVLMLKSSGLKTSLAAKIANMTKEFIRTLGSRLSWDPGFRPFDGLLETEYEWFVDVAEMKHIRIETNADMVKGKSYVSDWFPIGGGRKASIAKPVVVIRVDLSRLAQLLR